MELSDDSEVFAETCYSQIPVDNVVTATRYKSQDAVVPDWAKELEAQNKEQLDVSTNVSFGTDPVPQHDSVAASELASDSCMAARSPDDIPLAKNPPTTEAAGLSEVAGKYTTIQQLLQLNQQRVILCGADNTLIEHSEQPKFSTCVDSKAVTSLAKDYPVIHESLCLGRVLLNASGTREIDECVDVMSEQLLPVSVSDAPHKVTAVAADIDADLQLGDQVLTEPNCAVSRAEQSRRENLTAAPCESSCGHINHGQYMDPGIPHYYPVYRRLRYVETGDTAAVLHCCTAKTAAPCEHALMLHMKEEANSASNASEVVQDIYGVSALGHTRSDANAPSLERNNKLSQQNTHSVAIAHSRLSDAFSLHIVNTQEARNRYPESVPHVDDGSRTELIDLHYDGLSSLKDVESGKMFASYSPARRAADASTVLSPVHNNLSEQKDGKQSSVLEDDNYNFENGKLLDELADNDGFTVVETKKRRRQRQKVDLDDPVTLPLSSAALDESYPAELRCISTDADEACTAEPCQHPEAEENRFTRGTSMIQNSSEYEDVNEISGEIKTNHSPTRVSDVHGSTETSAACRENFRMENISDVPAAAVIGEVADRRILSTLEYDEAQADMTGAVDSAAADGLENIAEIRHVLPDKTATSTDLETEDDQCSVKDTLLDETPSDVAMEPEAREQVPGEVGSSVLDEVVGFDEKIVTNTALEAVDGSEMAVVKLTGASDLIMTAANETVRVERLTTVAPKSVVRIVLEPWMQVTGKDLESVAGGCSNAEKSVENETEGFRESKEEKRGEENVESEKTSDAALTLNTVAEVEHDLKRAPMAAERMETLPEKEAVGVYKERSFPGISGAHADIEKRLFNTNTTMLGDGFKAEKIVAYYAGLATLRDVETGRVHQRLKASRFLQEWNAANVDDVVAYIIGSETKKHRRKHRRIKRASESEVDDVKPAEDGSENVTFSLLRAKSEENVLCIDEQPEGVDSAAGEEEESGADDEDGSFTVVESRKHRRQRQRYDAEEMWAQYLDDEDAVKEPGENLHDAEAGLVPGARFSDSKRVEVVSDSVNFLDSGVAEVMSATHVSEADLEMGPSDKESATRDDLTSELEPSVEFGHRGDDTKLDSFGEDTDVSESTMPHCPFKVEVRKDFNTEVVRHDTDAQPLQDRPDAKSVQDDEHTTLENGACVIRSVHSRLYSDVARSKNDSDEILAKPVREFPTVNDTEVVICMDLDSMPAVTEEASRTELAAEIVWSAAENVLAGEVPAEASGLETAAADAKTHYAEKFVGKYVGDSASSDTGGVSFSVAEIVDQLREPPLELPNAMPANDKPDPVSALKPDVEVSSADSDTNVPFIEVAGAELCPSAPDVDTRSSCSPSSGSQSGAKSHVLKDHVEATDEVVSQTSIECSDQLPVAENLDLPTPQAADETAVEPALVLQTPQLQSINFEYGVPVATSGAILPASHDEFTTEVTTELHSADDTPAVMTEDEQHVERLFSEGAKAVKLRSDLAAGTVIENERDKPIPDSNVELTKSRVVKHNAHTVDKSALASVERFVAEILPYYRAALTVLQDIESGVIRLPCDSSSPILAKEPAKMTATFPMLAGDQALSDALAVEKSRETGVSEAVEDRGVPKTVLNDVCRHSELAVPFSAVPRTEAAPPTSEKCLQNGLNTGSVAKHHLLDQYRTDAGTLQTHYQSLKLLQAVEAGSFPSLSAQSASGSNPPIKSMSCLDQLKEESAGEIRFGKEKSVENGSSPVRDVSTNVVLDDNSVCAVYQEPPTVDSQFITSGGPAAVASVAMSAKHSVPNAVQSMYDGCAERFPSSVVSADFVTVLDTPSTDLRAKEPPLEPHVQARGDEKYVDVRGSELNVHSQQSVYDDTNGSSVNIDTTMVGVNSDSAQSPPSFDDRNFQHETVSNGLTAQELCDVGVCDLPLPQQTEAKQTLVDQHANQEALCDSERSLKENVSVPTSVDTKILAVPDLSDAKTKKRKRNRKKAAKSTKDDLTQPEVSPPACTDVPLINNVDNTIFDVSESSIMAEPRIADEGVQASTLILPEPSDGVSKKNKKRKRKKKGERAMEGINAEVSEDAVTLQTSVCDSEQNVVGLGELSDLVNEVPGQSPCTLFVEVTVPESGVEDTVVGKSQSSLPPVGVEPAEKNAVTLNTAELLPTVSAAGEAGTSNDNVEKLSELNISAVDGDVSSLAVVDGESAPSTKTAQRKNRRKRKTKAGGEPDAVAVRSDIVSPKNVPSDFVVEKCEQEGISSVTETDELMTESLEEDATITEQPLDILRLDDSENISDQSSSIHFVPPVPHTAGKKKRKRKRKASKIVFPCMSAGHSIDVLKDVSPKIEDSCSNNHDFADETYISVATTTNITVAALAPTVQEVDNISVNQSTSGRGQLNGTEQETQLQADGGPSSDESELHKSVVAELAADSTVALADTKKQKKKRRRNRQRIMSQKTSCFDAENLDTDLGSLLLRIVKICSETKHSQSPDSSEQPPPHSPNEPGTHAADASTNVHASKAPKKLRKYQRAKPIRLPPDVAELSVEAVALSTSKSSADADRAGHSEVRPTARFSVSETGKSKGSTDGVIDSSDDTTADDRCSTENVVTETKTIIAWSTSSASNVAGPSSSQFRSIQDSIPGEDVSHSHRTQTLNEEDIDCTLVYPVDFIHTEPQERCQEDEQTAIFHEFKDDQVDIAGCLAADVFTVISQHTNTIDSADAATFASRPNLADTLRPSADTQRVPEADDNGVGKLYGNSTPSWIDSDRLLRAPTTPCCETSSVDSEVERIFASGHVVANASSSNDDGEACAGDSVKDAEDDDDELALEEDLVVTEYIDVEIVEETETVTVLDEDDYSSRRSVSDGRRAEISCRPAAGKSIGSGTSVPRDAHGREKQTAENAEQVPPSSFRLHENEVKYLYTASLPCELSNAKAPPAGDATREHDRRTEAFHPHWLGGSSATGNRPTFHRPTTLREPVSGSNVLEVAELQRFSRKRHHPKEYSSSSDSADDGRPPRGDAEVILAQHPPPASGISSFDQDRVWSFFADDAHRWPPTSNDEVDSAAFFGENRPPTKSHVVEGPPVRSSDVGAVVQPGGHWLSRVHRDCVRDGDDELLGELSGDSLDEYTTDLGGFFGESATLCTRSVVASGHVPAGAGAETWESCSTDSLDCQTKTGPVGEVPERGQSSTDYISEDSLAETRRIARTDDLTTEDTAATTQGTEAVSSAEAASEQRRDTGHCRVSVRPKRFRGVRAKFNYSKGGLAVKTDRKRKLGNATEDGNGETDTDSAERE